MNLMEKMENIELSRLIFKQMQYMKPFDFAKPLGWRLNLLGARSASLL